MNNSEIDTSIDKESFKKIFEEMDNGVNVMLIFFSLMTGFTLAVFFEMYFNSPSFTYMAIFIIFILLISGLINIAGLFYGIWFITIPNEPKLLEKFYKGRIGLFIGKKKWKTYEDMFNGLRKRFILLRLLCWISLSVMILLFCLLAVFTFANITNFHISPYF
jgi:hypothetical protein